MKKKLYGCLLLMSSFLYSMEQDSHLEIKQTISMIHHNFCELDRELFTRLQVIRSQVNTLKQQVQSAHIPQVDREEYQSYINMLEGFIEEFISLKNNEELEDALSMSHVSTILDSSSVSSSMQPASYYAPPLDMPLTQSSPNLFGEDSNRSPLRAWPNLQPRLLPITPLIALRSLSSPLFQSSSRVRSLTIRPKTCPPCINMPIMDLTS